MASEFSGVGWRFPIQIANGKIAAAQGEDTVRQAIWMILGTTPGERPMRPDFGCGIHALVFAPVNPSTLGQLASEVQQALLLWEPRIDVISVTAEPVPGKPQEIAIAIDYRVRANNSRFNLVYPFYLE